MVPALAALLWVDLHRCTPKSFADWLAGDTSDGLSQVGYLLAKSFSKGY